MKITSRKIIMAAALTATAVGVPVSEASAKDKHEPWSVAWFQNHHHPSGKYWDKVAWCETHRNWKDKGNWGGGLGIARSTWRGFGGYQFAGHPSRATREEQIQIANRIAVHGYIRQDGTFQHPAGFGGWGCIRLKPHLTPPKRSLWYRWQYD